jgi:hypothetical protein
MRMNKISSLDEEASKTPVIVSFSDTSQDSDFLSVEHEGTT